MVMEATRRTMGPLLAYIGMASLLYALLGAYLPGVLAHRGYSVVRLVNHIYLGTEGIYGIASAWSRPYVFHFVLFGVLAQMTGLGRLFMDLATIAAGRYSGGPAKACVVSSGLFGMISGSPVANAVTTGSLTIPLMKKYGFSARFAGAIEGVGLLRRAGHAAGDGRVRVRDGRAARRAVQAPRAHRDHSRAVPLPRVPDDGAPRRSSPRPEGVEPHLIPRIGKVMRESWHLLFPLVALVTLLLLDYTPFLAAFWASCCRSCARTFRWSRGASAGASCRGRR
jgi:TRAP-type uncharacterized transport system fused permease subunit